MKKKVSLISFIISIMCLLLISSPYIPQTVNNIIKLSIEFFVLILFSTKFKINSKSLLSCIPIFIYLIVALFSTFKWSGLSTRMMNVVVTIGAYIIFFLIINCFSQKYSKDKIIKIIKNNLLVYSTIMDVLVIITFGKGIGNTVEPTFLLGSKFMISYLHMFILSILYYNSDKKYKANIYYLFSLCIVIIADTTTGIVGLSIIFLINTFSNISNKLLDFLSNPKTVILFFIITNIVFLLSPILINNDFITSFFYSRSHTTKMLSGRLVMFEICKKAIEQNLFWGYGINYDIVTLTLGFGNPQNGMLKLLLDFGILGTVSFCMIIYTCFKKISKHYDYKIKILLCSFVYAMLFCSLVEINLSAIFMLGLSLSNIVLCKENQ